MPITGFTITNYQALRSAKCIHTSDLMVITGPNGVGKSTLLELISRRFNNGIVGQDNIRIDSTGSPTVVYLTPHRSPVSSPMHKSISLHLPSRSYSQSLSQSDYYIGSSNIPQLSQLFYQSYSRSKTEPDFAPFMEIKCRLIDYKSKFKDLLDETYDSKREILKDSMPDIFQPFYDAINLFLPGVKFKEIKIVGDLYKIYFINKNNVLVDFDQLSSGEKDLIAMLFPIIEIKTENLLSSNKTNRKAVQDLVVLMDSPESHLHSSLLVNMLKFLRNSIADAKKEKWNLQVIISTHSQSIIENCLPGELFLMQYPNSQIDNQLIDTINLDITATRTIMGELGLSALSSGKPIILLEGKMDKEILQILYPQLESKYTLLYLIGKGKITKFVDSFDKVIEELVSRGIAIHPILDRDRDLGQYLSGKKDETRKRITVLPVSCLENFLLHKEAIFNVLFILLGKEKLKEWGITTPDHIDDLIFELIKDGGVREAELRKRLNEQLSFNISTSNIALVPDKIESEMDLIVEKRKAKIRDIITNESQVIDNAIKHKSTTELDGKIILSQLANKFHLNSENLTKLIADKMRELQLIPPQLTSILNSISKNNN